MAPHASPLTVIRANGRAFVAIGDMVNVLHEIADAVDGGQQAASATLRMLAKSFMDAAGGDELFHAPPPDPRLCNCGEPIWECDQMDAGTIVIAAEPTTYGRWIVLVGTSGRQVAVKYDERKHGRLKCDRYREHACRSLS